jgi:two-component system response regulator NreC
MVANMLSPALGPVGRHSGAVGQGAATPAGVGPLTARETEVLRLTALGYTSVEIARTLGLSPRTVETHRAHIHRKLGLGSRAELVRYALRHKLLVV